MQYGFVELFLRDDNSKLWTLFALAKPQEGRLKRSLTYVLVSLEVVAGPILYLEDGGAIAPYLSRH